MRKVYKNGEILTITDQKVDWMIVENKNIIELGVGNHPYADLEVDLKGKTLMPGFINAHMHPLPTGMEGTTIPLFEDETLDHVIGSIKNITRKDDETFLLAEGFLSMIIDFDQAAFEQLNAISESHPIAIKYITGHGMVLNQNAMDQLGSKDYFISDDLMAEANNLFSDAAVEGFIKKVSAMAVSAGFTTLHTLIYGDLSDNRDVPKWISEEKHRHELEIQVVNYVQTTDVDYVKSIDLDRIGGCVCLDGTPIEGSAAFELPYADGHCAELYLSDDELYEMVSKAHQNNVQCAFHAVGDKAVHQVINCYQRVTDQFGKKDLRHRIEHVDLISDDKLKQASELGLVFSVQPSIGFLYGDGFEEILGKERVEILNSLKRYEEAGIVLAGGTDSPVTPLNALLGIHAAVNSAFKQKRLEPENALKMFTIGAAFAGHQEDIKGTLEKGKQADFVILNENPLTSHSIKDIEVIETIVAGESVYKKE